MDASAKPEPAPITSRSADVVIVGAGFAGLEAARGLAGSGLSIIVVDRRNHHLFQPLLYQVATASLSPADIAQPIRRLLSRHPNVSVVMGELEAIDWRGGEIAIADSTRIRYRRLVLATGSEYDYFGRDDWKALAPGLKSIDDARAIRSRLLLNFERAEMESDLARRSALMTAVIIGGGPTGVEMAGAIAEVARRTLARDFRHIDPATARVLLVEAGPRILPSFPPDLSAYAEDRLVRLGATVMTGSRVTDIGPDRITVAGTAIPTELLVWGAGIRATPVARLLDIATDRSRRIPVAADFSVPGRPGVLVLGDLAALTGDDGRPLPALAQVARQQGRHLARHLPAEMESGRPVPPFRFADRGNAAVIGRNAAVFDFGRFRLKGRIGWLLWAAVHVHMLIGFDKRLQVSLQWLWRWVTDQRGARLIG